ncbi:Ribosomal lysine N-methyltransferase 4 [Mycena chlorophos]|uniref:Ribosomal lysine N-methyltransferase 4 n=1 Tax=Mycena chlorophos TaxID=658473 RepID=A0A8H6WB08_MYCCL|nr:Ribosomal lysine N-methyltransferase 4 [Mycena chlorophos]
MDAVLTWFTTNGGTIDSASVGFTEFDGAGRGAAALCDIPEGHVLFKIPRSLLLSTATSALPRRVGLEQWRARKMHRGWAGLILCMMWETANGAASRWAPYLESLPSTFDTPMFWSEEDLEELRGTSVVEKLGKADAEKDFSEKSRPDIFPPATIPSFYTLEVYHIMGSRILSRSFDVEKDESESESEGEGDVGNTSSGSTMDVDEPHAPEQEDGEDSNSENGEDEGEDEDDSIVVSMVPLADMLNARYECENAKLFYEKDALGMMSTKPIKAGEQIWNTYGDLPNAELLRRYGHVDLLPLTQYADASTSDPNPNQSALGNPGDVVEIRADLILSVLNLLSQSQSEAKIKERIDWWLEQGGDDVLILESDHQIPPALISLIRLLQLDETDWGKTVEKDKPPKPKLDAESMGVVIRVLERRLGEYPTTIDADLALLQTANTELSPNKKHALAVRIGEKRILQRTLEDARARVVAAAVAASSGNGNGKKRKAGEEPERNTGTKTQRKR